MLLSLRGLAQAGEKTITLDTSVLIGNQAAPFAIGFQLADGSLTGDGNNAVVVSNIQFGGGMAIPEVCSADAQGGVTGDLSSAIAMSDLDTFAYCLQAFIPGTTLTFNVSYTNNVDPAGLPDEFVMVIFDNKLQPIPTTGGIALLQIDFNSVNPTVQVFAGDPTQSEPANGGFGIPISAPSVSGPSPSAPALVYPTIGATGVPLTPTLSWAAAAGATSYDVYFGTSSTPPFVTNTTDLSYTPGVLAPGTTYYWQVVGKAGLAGAWFTGWYFTTSSGPPAPVSVSPAAGSGATQTFSFTFQDPAGYADLKILDVLTSTFLDGQTACYLAFLPSSASAGTVYLVDDAGDAGGPFAGSLLINGSSGGSIGNSQCTINASGSSVSASGSTLTLNLAMTLSPGWAGNKAFYMAARTATQNSGWEALGTWSVPGTLPAGPQVGPTTPARSVSTGQTYTFTFNDSAGYGDLFVLDVLTSSFLDGSGACYSAYVPTSASNGYLYLVDDAGDGGYAPGSPIALSSGGTLSNSQCTLNTTGSSASGSGNTLTLNLPIVFKPSFAGNHVFFEAARNNSTGNSGWQAAGSVTVP